MDFIEIQKTKKNFTGIAGMNEDKKLKSKSRFIPIYCVIPVNFLWISIM